MARGRTHRVGVVACRSVREQSSSPQASTPAAVLLSHPALRSALKRSVDRASEGKVTSRHTASVFFLFFFFNFYLILIAEPGLLLLWSQCVYGCCPFASARDAQDGGFACTCHATCAVAAARSRGASVLPSAPRTAAPRLALPTAAATSRHASARGGGGGDKCSRSRDGRKRLAIYGRVCVAFSGRWTGTVRAVLCRP